MNPQEQLIEKFYTSFQHNDWKAMQSCYHEELVFNDPVFQNLQSKEAKAMWHMLLSRSKDLLITFSHVKADGIKGSAHWVATYTFSKTNRKVINEIDASFEFKDGLIIQHIDYFDLWKWTRMAVGIAGAWLGWSSLFQNKVRRTAIDSLKKFIGQNAQYL